jgi:biotin carboxyl carrier protein
MTLETVDQIVVSAESILEFQASFLSQDKLKPAATALATEMALKLGLERVSIGISEHGQAQVKAISHSADVESKHEVNRKIASAMDEAMSQSAVIVHPEIAGNQPRLMLAHAALVRGTGNQVCSIPLVNQHAVFGAMTIERSNSALFRKNEILAFHHIAALLGPIIFLKWHEDRPWYSRIRQDCSTWLRQHFANSDLAFKLGMYALAAAAFALLFIPVQYNVSAPARLEGSIQRALVAPENGYLQHAYARPGDKVKAHQVLAELADEELLLDIRRWESELAQHENTYSAALAQSDRVQMVVNESKAQEAKTQLALAQQKLSRSRIVAPFDGTIIKGDLKQLLGAPVQRGDTLLTIAPTNSFRLIVEVDERDIAEVSLNQAGKIALVSLPGKALPFHVLRITPAATNKDERNFFEVEGILDNKDAVALRPGLEGVAKIKAGKHAFIWTLSHRLIDWAKITLWKWGW